MRLVMIRHGHAHTSGVIADVRACQGLSDEGRRQAQALGLRLRRWQADGAWETIVSSPVPRALETAKIVREATGAQLSLDPDLRELLPGEAEGLTFEEYRARYGDFDPRAEPDRPRSPGGETWAQFQGQLCALMQRFAARRQSENVIAINHAGVIVHTFLQLMAVPHDERAWLEPSNTGLTEWRCDGARWHLERYNDLGHLAA